MNPISQSPIAPAPSITTSNTGCGELLQASKFVQTLLNHVQDGVVFVDRDQQIAVWNPMMEVMTGLSADDVARQRLTPQLFGLADQQGRVLGSRKDPIAACISRQSTSCGHYQVIGRSGREVKVELTCTPVLAADRSCTGAVILVHDASVQLDLQRQLKDLYEFSMRDSLTQVANRAEFERALEEFVDQGTSSETPGSLIICDLDFFKQVNDSFNHHVGDQILVSFAALLQQFARPEDLVARYGGEEFVMLCSGCNHAEARQRAERIRVTLCETPQPMLNGGTVTASFGLSQLKPGETATDFFIRADTALLAAKENGRNCVEVEDQPDEAPGSGEDSWLDQIRLPALNRAPLIFHEYRTRTPVAMLVEKLRGYILETDAEIRRVETNFASLVVEQECPENYARRGRFEVDLNFDERRETVAAADAGPQRPVFGRRTYTYLRLTIREGQRKWVATNANDLASAVLTELQRYLLSNDDAFELLSTEPPRASEGH